MASNDSQYLKLVKNVLENGTKRKNRTGVDTVSVFGTQVHYDLTDNKLPLLTTKYVDFDLIKAELLWFLAGDTNQRHLEDNGCKIWKANASRLFLDSRGLSHYKANETLGPIYGFQWRHYGADYKDSDTDYTGQGFDQLQHIIHMIKNDPDSRRIILTAWNPLDVDKMALPPCHVISHFLVNKEKGELSCHLFQRSADVMLGVPFNIASYSMLTHLLAKLCGLTAAELVHTMSDTHIYENHIVNAEFQLQRKIHDSPKLEIILDKDANLDNITVDSFKLIGYKSEEPLTFMMAL